VLRRFIADYIAPGWGERTQWYLNIRANPRVTVQRNGKTLAATALLVTDDTELAELYHLALKDSPVWKQYLTSRGVEDTLEDFLAKRDRVPALRLDPVAGDPPLAPLRRDLWWVWAVLALIGLLLWWLL
jgi:deazaflavin-dependent oxidoreductase (nitroreductase family)